MLGYAVRYAVALVILAGGDGLWLSYFAGAVFRPTLGPLLRDPPSWTAIILFYLLYPVGIVCLAVAPALQAPSAKTAILCGALFGFMAYMTYDLTNFATLRVWTVRLAAMDVAWGTVLTALCALGSYLAARAAS